MAPELPLTTNGKIDLCVLQSIAETEGKCSSSGDESQSLENQLVRLVARIIGVPADQLDPEQSLFQQGMDSFALVALLTAIEQDYQTDSQSRLLEENFLNRFLQQPTLKVIYNEFKLRHGLCDIGEL